MVRAALVILGTLTIRAQTPVETIVPGVPVEREIKSGEVHIYEFSAAAGQYLYAVVTPQRLDIKASFVAPGGKTLAVPIVPWLQGPEDVSLILPDSGQFRIAVETSGNGANGAYTLDLRPLREPAAQDTVRVAAYQAFLAAEELSATAKAESRKRAAAKYEESLAGWKTADDLFWQGKVLHQIGMNWEQLGQVARARDAFLAALPLRREAGNRLGEGNTLNYLGLVYNGLGDPAKALEYLTQALELRRSLHDRKGEAVTLNNIAISHQRMGEPARAVEMLKQSLAIRRETGDRLGEAVTLNNIGSQYRELGDLQAALEYQLSGLKIRRELGDRRGEAAGLANVGGVYGQLGETKRAREYWKQSVAAYEAVGDRRGLATVLSNIANSYTQMGNGEQALPHLERSLAIRREIGDRQGEVLTLTVIGAAQFGMGKYAQARDTQEKALAIAREIKFRRGEGTCLHNAANADLKLGEPERARERLREAVAIFQAIGFKEQESSGLASLAQMELAAGNPQQALEYSRLAVAILETMRGGVENPELRASFRASKGGRYGLHVAALMTLHQASPASGLDVQALDAIERYRARSLVETLAESHIDLRHELSPEQRRREDQILGRINQTQRELFRAGLTAAPKAQLEERLAAAERELDTFQLALNESGSRYAAVQYAKALGQEQIRRELLNEDTALIEYALGEHNSYVWVLTPASFNSAVLPARAVVERQVEEYRKELAQKVSALTVRAALARLNALGADLYRELIAPVEASLGRARRLIIVPDGVLAYVPFEALGRKERLIERFAISYAPSASALAALRSRSVTRPMPPQILVAFGDPVYTTAGGVRLQALDTFAGRGFDFTPLPHTRAEIMAIRSLYPGNASRVYLGAEAREENVKGEQLDQFRFVHFAAHGHYDEEQPARSGIVLSASADPRQDGVLQVSEIMRLRLRAEMVSLSACQTGLGKLLAGEGVAGLGRAFLFAGAESLLMSLWSVNDASTAELMKNVYQNMNRGLNRDEALRQAKLKLLRSQQSAWRHPHYWAAFVLTGNAAPGR